MADTKGRRKQQKVDRVPVERARPLFKELLNDAEFRGKRTVITRYGKPSAALVSMADLEKLEGAA